MTDTARARLLRCARCRILFESTAARPECSVCHTPILDDEPHAFDDEPAQKTPTRGPRSPAGDA